MEKRKSANKLTVKTVDKLLRAGQQGKHLDRGSKESVRGLYLVVAGPRAAHWELRYQLDNRPTRYMGLGSAFEFDLTQARERARSARQKLRDGIDPLAVRQAERAALKAAAAKRLSFAGAAAKYHETHRSQWTSNHYADQFISSLERWAFPFIGATDVAEVGKDQILRILEQTANGGSFWNMRTTTADRVRNRIRQVLDWCVARGFRPEGANPAAWKGTLKFALPTPSKVSPVKNLPAMHYKDVPALLAALATKKGIGIQALKFTIHTAARVSEVIGARRGEINFEEGVRS